jgi:DNA-binding response OmpR family regulator
MRKVLIADDNPDLAQSLKLALEANGYRVEVARNGADAIACQVTFDADILITDLVMPEQDGFETLNAFRKEFPQTRLVVMSGAQTFDPDKYLHAATLIGAAATFRKPFRVEDLLAKLQSL